MSKKRKSPINGLLSQEVRLKHTPRSQELNLGHLASSFMERAQELYQAGDLRKALKDYEAVILNYESLGQKSNAQFNGLIQAHIEKGRILIDLNEHEEALSSFSHALNQYAQERLLNQTHLDEWLVIYGRIQRGMTYQHMNNWAEALTDFQQALAWMDKSQELRSPGLLGFTYFQLGITHHRLENLNLAKEFYQKCWDFHQTYHRENSDYLDAQEWALSGINLAKIYEDQSALDAALQVYQKTLSMLKDAEVHHQVFDTQTFLVACLNQAHIHQQISAYEHCISTCDEVIERSEPLEDQWICTVQAHNLKGLAHWKLHQLELAKQDYLAALELYERLFAQGERIELEWAQSWTNLAHIFLQLEEPGSAHQAFESAITKYQQLKKSHRLNDPSLLGTAYMGLSSASQAMGDIDQAQKELKLGEQFLKNNPTLKAQFLMNKGGLYQNQSRLAEAIKTYQAVIDLMTPQNAPLDPAHPLVQAHYLLGFVYALEYQDLPNALNHFHTIESLSPGFASYDLACLAAQNNDVDEAMKWLIVHYNTPYRVPKAQVESDQDLEILHEEILYKDLIQAWPETP